MRTLNLHHLLHFITLHSWYVNERERWDGDGKWMIQILLLLAYLRMQCNYIFLPPIAIFCMHFITCLWCLGNKKIKEKIKKWFLCLCWKKSLFYLSTVRNLGLKRFYCWCLLFMDHLEAEKKNCNCNNAGRVCTYYIVIVRREKKVRPHNYYYFSSLSPAYLPTVRSFLTDRKIYWTRASIKSIKIIFCARL